MELSSAESLVKKYFARLNKVYAREVFDEFSIVSLASAGGHILAYHGPRADDFSHEFADDMTLLRKEILTDRPEGGNFGFTREGAGSYFDAYIALGNDFFLICNNTLKSMEEITKDPLWLEAQTHFVELSQCFAVEELSA